LQFSLTVLEGVSQRRRGDGIGRAMSDARRGMLLEVPLRLQRIRSRCT